MVVQLVTNPAKKGDDEVWSGIKQITMEDGDFGTLRLTDFSPGKNALGLRDFEVKRAPSTHGTQTGSLALPLGFSNVFCWGGGW